MTQQQIEENGIYREILDQITDEAVEKAVDAIESAIHQSTARPMREDDDDHMGDLIPLLAQKLGRVPNSPVTPEDALDIAMQAIEDTGSSNMGDPGWRGYEGTQEGVSNHAQYHLGRPGECGPGCPGIRNRRAARERAEAEASR